MKILVHESFSFGHSLHSFCLLLMSEVFQEACKSGHIHVTIFLPEALADSLLSELSEDCLSVCELKTYEIKRKMGRWRERLEVSRILITELRRVEYDRVLILSGDLQGVFAPLIHSAAPKADFRYQVYRTMFCYREAGYPMNGYTGRRYFGPLLKNRMMFLWYRLGMISGFLFEDEMAVKCAEKKKIFSRLIRTPAHLRTVSSRQRSTVLRFTLFGVLSAAKHVPQVIEAWKNVPEPLRKRAHLRVCGKSIERDRECIHRAAGLLEDGSLQLEDRFLADEEVESLLAQTDVLIHLYSPEHVGCSAVLIQAALCGIPVVVVDRGWLGFMTRKYKLGKVLPETGVDDIRCALEEIISTGGIEVSSELAGQFTSPFLGDAYAESMTSVMMEECL